MSSAISSTEQVTALARPELLERVSEVVAPQQRSGGDHADIDLTALTEVERRRLSNLLARLTTLAEAAAQVKPTQDHTAVASKNEVLLLR